MVLKACAECIHNDEKIQVSMIFVDTSIVEILQTHFWSSGVGLELLYKNLPQGLTDLVNTN